MLVLSALARSSKEIRESLHRLFGRNESSLLRDSIAVTHPQIRTIYSVTISNLASGPAKNLSTQTFVIFGNFYSRQ